MKILQSKISTQDKRWLMVVVTFSVLSLAVGLPVVRGLNLLGPLGLLGGLTVAHAQTPQPSSQKTYASPDDAMSDLIAATKAKDMPALGKMFGPGVKDLLSGDPVQQKAEFEEFSDNIAKKAILSKKSDASYVINVGDGEWPFPVPIVKQGSSWVFDTKTGVDELLTRRIGENELDTIMVCRAYALAQWEYFFEGDWDSDLVQEFAQKFISAKGQRDGLYWPSGEYDTLSPMGQLLDTGYSEGYRARDKAGNIKDTPYHGYYFRMLKSQGAYAPGSRYSYVINGNMIGGFGLVASPAKHGSSGVMTFIVNQQGRVYQKDLGPNTEAIAKAMTEYNPDPSWKAVLDGEE